MDQSTMLIKHRDTIQQRPDFKDGNLDIDNLCAELRKKAKCSESGVVVDKHDLDAALQRLPGSRTWGTSRNGNMHVMSYEKDEEYFYSPYCSNRL